MEEKIKVGHLVLICLDAKRQFLVQARSQSQISTDFGNIDLKEIIGKPYGIFGESTEDSGKLA